MRASNPENLFCRVRGLNPGPADNRFRLSAQRRALCQWATETRSFKVICLWWFRRKARQQCLLLISYMYVSSATVLLLDELIAVKWRFLRGTSLWRLRSRGITSPSGMKVGHIKIETPRYHTVKTWSLYFTLVWEPGRDRQQDRRTDGRADGQIYDS